MNSTPLISREKNERRCRRGFALAFSLVFFAITTFLLLGLFSMISSSTRATEIYIGRNQCRLAAQSVIEFVKPQIDVMFTKHTGGATVRIGPKTSTAYSWFNTFTDNSLGTGKYTYYLPTTNMVVNGCRVKMRFGVCGQVDNSSSAIVSLIARARRQNANGTVSDVALEERFRFGIGRSKVFDYAYFVNNYGWFQGTGCTANGDVRANGDMYLDAGCKVNGEVWAANNDELRVTGNINATGKMDTRSEYWGSDKTTSQSRPTSPTCSGGKTWIGGYDAPESTTVGGGKVSPLQERTHPNEEVGISMPWISDLEQYVEYAQDQGGTLSGGYRYTHNVENDSLVKQNMTTVNAHYDGAGPSGDPSLSDKGSLVIEGTRDNPIKIKGPVVIDSDVIIKGYVTGQGTIYSGRNIHMLGNITYVNPPNWPHPDTNPEATAKANSTKDLVAFAAKGNIVFSYDSSGFSGISTYLGSTPYVQRYICDDSDRNIGYPRTKEYGYSANETSFCGNYRSTDGGSMVARTQKTRKETVTETYKEYDNWQRKYVEKTRTVEKDVKYWAFVDSKTRHYYDSVVNSKILSSLYDSSKKITKIDGVLYNNHGIFGYLGACTVNGAMICRNEGIQYSDYLNINWDIRLREDSKEGISNDQLGAPVGASPPGVVSFHEIPIDVANLEM